MMRVEIGGVEMKDSDGRETVEGEGSIPELDLGCQGWVLQERDWVLWCLAKLTVGGIGSGCSLSL